MATKKVVGIDTTGKEKLGLGRYNKKRKGICGALF
jgi:hypothetical protein